MRKLAVFAALVAAIALSSGVAMSAQGTTQDTSISIEVLNKTLTPLTKKELEAEAGAWVTVVKVAAQKIAAADIAGETASLGQLRTDRDAAIERARAVLAALQTKGGDIAEHDAYLSAVAGGITEGLDPTDAGAFMTTVVDWVTAADGGIALGLNILKFLAILFVFKILAGILARVTYTAVSRVKQTSELLRDFFVNTVRKGVFFVGLVIALSALGVDIGPLLAGIGVLGFVIGFALQGTLSNFACGVMILLYRPYDLGDVVTVSGVTGKVDAMSLVSTTVKTPDNQTVVVPNSKIWGDVITNITGNETRRVDMTFGIGYGDDIEQAHKLLEEIVTGHNLVLDDPAPVVKVHELADSSVNFVVRPWAKTSDYWAVYWDLTRTVKERFDAEAISIPFPQRDVHIHQQAAG